MEMGSLELIFLLKHLEKRQGIWRLFTIKLELHNIGEPHILLEDLLRFSTSPQKYKSLLRNE